MQHFQYRPFEEDHVEIVVVLGKYIADDARRISGTDLVAGQDKVDALSKVPQLSSHVVCEWPGQTYRVQT